MVMVLLVLLWLVSLLWLCVVVVLRHQRKTSQEGGGECPDHQGIVRALRSSLLAIRALLLLVLLLLLQLC